MPKDNKVHNIVLTTVQALAGVAGDRMANRTVAYLNCQILVGDSFLERRGRWWTLPTRRSVPNMNMLGSAVVEILPFIAQIFVFGLNSFSLVIQLAYAWFIDWQNEAVPILCTACNFVMFRVLCSNQTKTGSLGRRVSGSFGSSFQSGSPGPRVIIVTQCATRFFLF